MWRAARWERLTYKYSLIAVILVPIICTLSMSLLVPLASVPTTINNSVRFSVEHELSRCCFIIFFFSFVLSERASEWIAQNCQARMYHADRSTAGRATKETWTESILYCARRKRPNKHSLALEKKRNWLRGLWFALWTDRLVLGAWEASEESSWRDQALRLCYNNGCLVIRGILNVDIEGGSQNLNQVLNYRKGRNVEELCGSLCTVKICKKCL